MNTHYQGNSKSGPTPTTKVVSVVLNTVQFDRNKQKIVYQSRFWNLD